MVGTVDELRGDWGMDSDIVWDEGLGGGVSGEDVEKVGCDSAGAGNDCYRWEGSSWERFGRSYWRVSYFDGLESVLQLVQNQ